MSKKRATMREVAALAGVSYQTVSRVINQSDQVRPATRLRVETAIAELNYQPNANARSMARGHTSMLACIAPNLTDYTFASIINGAEQKAREEGYFLLSSTAPTEDVFASLAREFVQGKRVDGIIVINPYADKRHILIPEGFPVVLAGARPGVVNVNSVVLDDVAVAEQATRHLIELGHCQIACVTGPMGEQCARDRVAGFINALVSHALPVDQSLIIEGDWSAQSGYDALLSMVFVGDLPTAIFAQNDQMAAGIMRAARQLNISLPAELSIIGIDDLPLASFLEPPLTTFRQEFSEIGRVAASMLIDSVKGVVQRARQVLLPGELRLRRSTDCLKR